MAMSRVYKGTSIAYLPGGESEKGKEGVFSRSLVGSKCSHTGGPSVGAIV